MCRNLAAGVQAFTSNVFLCEGERRTLVDAGNDFDVVGRTREHVEDVDRIALTHTHPDHVGALPDLREAFDADVLAFDPSFDGVDEELADGDTFRMGDHEYEVVHTPGHKEDHCCFYAREPGILFAGDLVFADGAFGRTDLEGADRDTLVESIDRLLDLVDEDLAAMHPGHGRSVTDQPYQAIELAGQAARF